MMNLMQKKYIKSKVNKIFIYNYLLELRKIITLYIRSIYILESIAKANENAFIFVYESLFSHILDKHLWVVGQKFKCKRIKNGINLFK